MDSCQDVLARALISQQHLSYVYRETIYAPRPLLLLLSARQRLHISRFSQLKVDGEQLERSGIRLTIALGGIFRFVVVVVEHINRSLLSTRRLNSLEKPACAGGVVYFIDVG